MVGALWIDSGSDSDSDVAQGVDRHQRRLQDVNAIAGPSRLDLPQQPRGSPRRSANPPPSSSGSVIALSSSQDRDEHAEERLDRHGKAASGHIPAGSTSRRRIAHLLAEPSPDTSLPSFRELLLQHKSRSIATASRDAIASSTRASTSGHASERSRRTDFISSRPTRPTPAPKSNNNNNNNNDNRNAAIPEVIEIASDSIVDPASEAADAPLVLQTSSPIRSQFSARHQLSSSQPLAFSPPRRAAAVQSSIVEHAALDTRGARRAFRAESAPIVILSSSPPPASLPRTSQRSIGNTIGDIPEDDCDLPDLPPSSFPFDDPLPSPPFSPVDAPRAIDTSILLQRRAAELDPKSPLSKRAKGLTRTTSLLDALDKLYDQADIDIDMARPSKTRKMGDSANDASPSKACWPTKAQKAAAAKEAREAKARDRQAAKAIKLRAAAAKKRFLQVNRLRTSKSDTMRELIVDLDRSLFGPGQPLASFRESMTTRFREQGASVHLCDGVVAPPLVRFRRKVEAEWNAERRHWVPLEQEEVRREGMVIVYVDAKEVVEVVGEGGEQGLESWYRDLKRRVEVMNGTDEQQTQVFLICQGLVKFYSRVRANENRAYTARIRQQLAENQPGTSTSTSSTAAAAVAADNAVDATTAPKATRRKTSSINTNDAISNNDVPTQALVERCLLQLKLIHRCYVIHASSVMDGVEWLHQLTTDLSLKPYKSLRDTHLSFAVDTRRHTTSSSCPTIYSMMLQQIPRLTPSIANSICTIYPSLQSLLQAYQSCHSLQDEKSLLATIQITSNNDGTQRSANRSNLGLQLSKRIHAVIRGSIPELLINYPTMD
ncbi:uncharacterized protein UTRI_02547 [Ustilago trichophora]|uniref:ERCC4 domain-containing protein n=1 Tax=Ustilago trichophora TaxID=86804 RepID=A0A5C3E9L2_9BASI|nr:uncharacterized protein UTRI_02547 [Ustilago trichophora]